VVLRGRHLKIVSRISPLQTAAAHEYAYDLADHVTGGDGLFHLAWVRALEKATASWEASSQLASSLCSVKAPGLRE
jgi:hypothetical protein